MIFEDKLACQCLENHRLNGFHSMNSMIKVMKLNGHILDFFIEYNG